MINLEFSNMEMQEYLKDKRITPAQAKIIFRFRTRMERLSENFKGGLQRCAHYVVQARTHRSTAFRAQ